MSLPGRNISMGKVTIAASGASPRPATAFVVTPTKSARVSVTVGIPCASSLAAARPHAVGLPLLVADKADALAGERGQARRVRLRHLDGAGRIVELEGDHASSSWQRRALTRAKYTGMVRRTPARPAGASGRGRRPPL